MMMFAAATSPCSNVPAFGLAGGAHQNAIAVANCCTAREARSAMALPPRGIFVGRLHRAVCTDARNCGKSTGSARKITSK